MIAQGFGATRGGQRLRLTLRAQFTAPASKIAKSEEAFVARAETVETEYAAYVVQVSQNITPQINEFVNSLDRKPKGETYTYGSPFYVYLAAEHQEVPMSHMTSTSGTVPSNMSLAFVAEAVDLDIFQEQWGVTWEEFRRLQAEAALRNERRQRKRGAAGVAG